ncbi:MAG: ABC transporter permease [Propionibacteriaceae bacterium]|nr:ABC transporter permease [Propionibacteriaceae bacterium]
MKKATSLRPKLRLIDVLREAVTSVAARPARSVLTMLGTTLGTGAFVVIIGLTSTASSQITSQFTQLEATSVTVTDQAGSASGGYHFPDHVGAIMRDLNGVVDAGVYFRVPTSDEARHIPIATRAQADVPDTTTGAHLSVYGAEAGTFVAAGATLSSGVFLDDIDDMARFPVAVLGQAAARSLGVGTVATRPTVFIGDEPYTVVGVVDSAGSLPELQSAVILPAHVALERYGAPVAPYVARALIRTDLGAARLISSQAPYALAPQAPSDLVAAAPPDWSTLTDPVNDSMNSLLLALAGVALLIGVVAIANTALVAVMERTGEIGLRRALGARASHIAQQFLLEAVVTGAVGGLIGGATGVLGVVATAWVRQWTPVLDPRLALVAPVIGVVAGCVAGLYPALKAARIQPSSSLRSA